jgi:hypothetical protein
VIHGRKGKSRPAPRNIAGRQADRTGFADHPAQRPAVAFGTVASHLGVRIRVFFCFLFALPIFHLKSDREPFRVAVLFQRKWRNPPSHFRNSLHPSSGRVPVADGGSAPGAGAGLETASSVVPRNEVTDRPGRTVRAPGIPKRLHSAHGRTPVSHQTPDRHSIS